jgi:lipopolysaccharide export system permease protein
MRLVLLTLRSVVGPGWVALVLIFLAGLLLQVGGLLMGSAVVPSLADSARIVVALAPAALEATLPVAFLVGLMVGYGRWHAEGTWTALRGAGLAGRSLLRPVLLPALLLVLVMASISHWWAPAGRRAAARTIAAAAASVELVPGRFVELGDVVLHRPQAGGLLVSQGQTVLLARQGTLVPHRDGLLLTLEHGQLVSLGPERLELSFEQASLPVVVSGTGRRVELAERSDAELAELVGRMHSRGKDASYERSLLLERSTLPLVPMLLPLLALPLGLRWGGRPGHTLLVVLGYWSLQRVGDAACGTLGALAAATLPLLGLGLAAVLLWARWRDR